LIRWKQYTKKEILEIEHSGQRMKKVIFICTHNSARSQMAEALMKQVCGEFFEVQSAGMQPGVLNPLAVEAMAELGIDITRKAYSRSCVSGPGLIM
jgi:protein-tyrosine-phosphatase